MKLKSVSDRLHSVYGDIAGKYKRKYLVWAGISLFLLVQFAVPPQYVTPRTYLGSMRVGFKDRHVLKQQFAAESEKIRFTHDSGQEEFNAEKVGIYPDVDATIDRLPVVTMKDRLIPGKPLYTLVKKHTVRPVVSRDVSTIKAFAASLRERINSQPQNARAEIKDGEFIITNARNGAIYSADEIEQALLEGNPFTNGDFTLSSEKIPAKIQDRDLQPVRDEFTKKTTQPLNIRYGDTAKVIEPQVLKTWFTVAQAPDADAVSLAMNGPVLDEHIQAWAKEYNVAPGITQVSYYDDRETSRKTGTAGRALDATAIKGQLKTWFDTPGNEPVTLASAVVAPKVVATRTYSRSSAQLQAKLEAWIASHSGRYQVAIRELNGRGREASYNVAQQTVMASTYKPFLAFVAYRQAENGALNLGAPLVNGNNIEQCIEVMIVRSDNPCAVSLGRYIGWAKVDQIIAAAGFRGVVLNNYDSSGRLNGDKLVNATEQARFLAQLSGGSLINGTNTNKLLGYMKRDIYRSGIPAGSRGAVVAHKVGFLDAYLHDVGVVYGAKSTYALVIMSEGSSWTNVRDLAQAVYDFMND